MDSVGEFNLKIGSIWDVDLEKNAKDIFGQGTKPIMKYCWRTKDTDDSTETKTEKRGCDMCYATTRYYRKQTKGKWKEEGRPQAKGNVIILVDEKRNTKCIIHG